MTFHNLMETPFPGTLPPELDALVSRYREIYESYQPADARYLTLHRGHLMFLRPEEEPLVGAELIRGITFTGTEAELRERLGELEEAGYRQWVIQLVPGQEQAIEDWAHLLFSRWPESSPARGCLPASRSGLVASLRDRPRPRRA